MYACLPACLSGQSSGLGGLREPYGRIRLPGIVEVVVASMAAAFDACWQGGAVVLIMVDALGRQVGSWVLVWLWRSRCGRGGTMPVYLVLGSRLMLGRFEPQAVPDGAGEA